MTVCDWWLSMHCEQKVSRHS